MKTRVISGAVLVIVLGVLLYFGGPVLLTALCAFSLIGIWELFRALKNKGIQPFWVVAAIAVVVLYAGLWVFGAATMQTLYLYYLALVFMILMLLSVSGYPRRTMADCAFTLVGIVYVAVMFTFIYILRQKTDGIYYVWYIFWAAWGSDTFAYLVGVACGRHKLTPQLSPKKSVEGAIGGILGAILLCMVYGAIIANFVSRPLPSLLILSGLIGLFGAILGQLGDLFASAIKRQTEIKDYGKLIPGHGGILDRFDSVLLVAPAIEMVMVLMEALKI